MVGNTVQHRDTACLLLLFCVGVGVSSWWLPPPHHPCPLPPVAAASSSWARQVSSAAGRQAGRPDLAWSSSLALSEGHLTSSSAFLD